MNESGDNKGSNLSLGNRRPLPEKRSLIVKKDRELPIVFGDIPLSERSEARSKLSKSHKKLLPPKPSDTKSQKHKSDSAKSKSKHSKQSKKSK